MLESLHLQFFTLFVDAEALLFWKRAFQASESITGENWFVF